MPIRSCSRATASCNYSRIPVGDDISPCFGLSGASARWQNMKSRHAAALALVVWYLMRPPLPHLYTYAVHKDTAAALRGWKMGRSSLPRRNARPTAPTHGERCVASDDPRLKEK